MKVPAERKVAEVKRYGKQNRGQKDILNYLQGMRLTQRQAIQAKCYDCQGYDEDGFEPCETILCPI